MKLIKVKCKDAQDISSMLVEFLKSNPNPADDVVHSWAEKNGLDIHEVEAEIYKLATKYVEEN